MKEKLNQYDSQGKPHGLWEIYYENDILWSKGHYRHGKPHRLREHYLRDGTLYYKFYYLRIR